jgi:pilus assembly protein Flp/PilA
MLGWFVRTALDFLKHEDGPTAVEYAVLLALIIAVLIAEISNIGTTTSGTNNNVTLKGVKVH